MFIILLFFKPLAKRDTFVSFSTFLTRGWGGDAGKDIQEDNQSLRHTVTLLS